MRKELLSQNTLTFDYAENSKMSLSIQNDCLEENEEYTITGLDSVETINIYLAETTNSINIKELQVSYITNNDMKTELIQLITNYKRNKNKETNLKVNIILTDEIPIAQRPRRLAFSKQEFMNKQIQEW